MNDNVSSKTDLWAERMNAFYKSGLSRKDWCRQNGIPLSTFNYWNRKLHTEESGTQNANVPVFMKLPSEQEICAGERIGSAPVTICIPENIRIEICADCPSRLMAALFEALKSYA